VAALAEAVAPFFHKKHGTEASTGNETLTELKEITMIRKIILSLTMFVLAIFLLVPPLALADTLTLSLSNPVQRATPGATLTFDATVSAPSTNAVPIFLNSDNYTIDSPLTLDDSDFFSLPLSLDPGDSYTGALFTITLPSGFAQGDYTGSFEILGGADGSAFDTLATTDFQISPTPEPRTMLLLATGLGPLGFVMYRKKGKSLSGV
jgi:hypothetical protein